MARSHSIASFRPAGFALLKPASKPQLDTARIITMSGTLAVNVLAMGLLMMPLSMPAPIALPYRDARYFHCVESGSNRTSVAEAAIVTGGCRLDQMARI